MCGIAGFAYMKHADALTKGTVSTVGFSGTAPDYYAMNKYENLLKVMLVNMRKKGLGSDATGIFIMNRTPHFTPTVSPKIYVYKKPGRAENFVETMYSGAVFSKVNPATTSYVVGHVRASTQGSPADNKNNHPFICNTLVGVHNGMISNDDEVYTLNPNLNRESECDSEAIFSLLQSKLTSEELSDIEIGKAVQETCREIRGSLTCVALDSRFPNKLIMFRRDAPLCVLYNSADKFFIFCSSEDIARSSIKERSLESNIFITLPFDNGTGRIFDTTKDAGLNSCYSFSVPNFNEKPAFKNALV